MHVSLLNWNHKIISFSPFIWETMLESMSINLAFRKIASRGYLSMTQMCSHALTL